MGALEPHHGTISAGAAPSTASLLAIRRSIVPFDVPSARRSPRQASAMAPRSRRFAAGDQIALNDHGLV